MVISCQCNPNPNLYRVNPSLWTKLASDQLNGTQFAQLGLVRLGMSLRGPARVNPSTGGLSTGQGRRFDVEHVL